MNFIKLAIISMLLLFFSPITEAKKRCKPLLEKLHKAQAMQRSGYSFKRGINLRAREDKARDEWWRCETGRSKSKNKKKRNKKKTTKTLSHQNTENKIKSRKIKATTPFKTNSAIVLKSKYQGNKKQAWIAFYQQPIQCQRPKNLQVFAFCSEDKQTQRQGFEKEYKSINNE